MDTWFNDLTQLKQRLPELERQLAKLHFFPIHALPRALFHSVETAADCIVSIQRDIDGLLNDPHAQTREFLAKQIQGKTAVLVHICRTYVDKAGSSEVSRFTSLNTRDQWLAQQKMAYQKKCAQKEALQTRIDIETQARTHQLLEPEVQKNLQLELQAIEHELRQLESSG